MAVRVPQTKAENMQNDLQPILSRDAILSEAYVDAAKKELYENPQHRAAHILSFKRAVQSVPHITCPDDERIYLAFLRHAKFQHSTAEKRMDNFVTFRTSPNHPQHAWVSRPDLTSQLAQEYLKAGVHLPLGFLEDGSFVFVIRLGAWRFDLAPFTEYIKFAIMQIDRMMEDPRVQIKGVVIILDMTKVSTKHMVSFNPRQNGKYMMQYLQEGCVLRVKNLIYSHEPPLMDAMIKLMMQWMKPKLKKRILRVHDDLSKAWTRIPGLKCLLPKEYGGDNDILENVIDKCAREFVQYFEKPLLWDGMKVDESKRPVSSKDLIKMYKDAPGLRGTYIQLPDDV